MLRLIEPERMPMIQRISLSLTGVDIKQFTVFSESSLRSEHRRRRKHALRTPELRLALVLLRRLSTITTINGYIQT